MYANLGSLRSRNRDSGNQKPSENGHFCNQYLLIHLHCNLKNSRTYKAEIWNNVRTDKDFVHTNFFGDRSSF